MNITDSLQPHDIVLAYKENDNDIIWAIFIHLHESYAAMYFHYRWTSWLRTRFRVRNHYSPVCTCVHAHTEECKTTGIFLKPQEYHWNKNVKEIMCPYCKLRGWSLLGTQKTACWTKWPQGYLHLRKNHCCIDKFRHQYHEPLKL